MNKPTKGTPIGKIVAKRVKGYTVYEEPPKEEPKKKPTRKKKLTRWMIIPAYTAPVLPKRLNEAAREKNYSFTAHVFSESYGEAQEALDHLIRCGQEEIEAGNNQFFWLHAVQHSTSRSGLFRVTLRFIFRARQVPEEISKEVK